MDGDGVQDALDRPAATDLTRLGGRIGHALKYLKKVAFRALVLIDGHEKQATRVPGRHRPARPATHAISPRLFRLGVAACTGAVAAFLVARLSAWPPHEDETLALLVARGSLWDVLTTVHGERGGAPLHFLLAWAVGELGGGLTALRLLSAAFATASVPLVALLGIRLAGRAAALGATVIVSASWMLLFHGIYGRMYSLFFCAGVLSYLALAAATEHGGRRRWALWGIASLGAVAAHPYGALVLASQGVYVLACRARVREALVAFGAVAVAGIPFWYTDLVLARRFEVGVGAGGERLRGPLDVLDYLARSAGDFTAGWRPVLAAVLAVAAVGLIRLWRESRSAAALALTAFAVPAATFLLARLGSATAPESRHLIFALPFFALLVASGVLTLTRRAPLVAPLALALLVAAELAWAHNQTPQLFEGEPAAREAARARASEWLAQTGRADDVLFGYDPLFLGAWERNRDLSRTIVPRADAKLALESLQEAGEPLGRGVWVLDASDTNNFSPQPTIERRVPRPGDEFETRVFGPFLVVRARESSGTPAKFLEQASSVMITGKSLFIGDADVNFVTVRRASDQLSRGGTERSRSASSR